MGTADAGWRLGRGDVPDAGPLHLVDAHPFRVDAGIISSPIGLGTLELRPDRNPTIGAPFYYFVPLPPIDGRFDGKRLITGGYPLGAVFSASGTRWELAPASRMRRRREDGSTPARVRSGCQTAVRGGGGVMPTPGLRLGVGIARGRYRSNAVSPKGTPVPAASATVFNVEGRMPLVHLYCGEWIADRLRDGHRTGRGARLQPRSSPDADAEGGSPSGGAVARHHPS